MPFSNWNLTLSFLTQSATANIMVVNSMSPQKNYLVSFFCSSKTKYGVQFSKQAMCLMRTKRVYTYVWIYVKLKKKINVIRIYNRRRQLYILLYATTICIAPKIWLIVLGSNAEMRVAYYMTSGTFECPVSARIIYRPYISPQIDFNRYLLW